MRSFRHALTTQIAALGLLVFVATGAATGPSFAQAPPQRDLRNGWEVHRELVVSPQAHAEAPKYFPSFFEYHDMVMFHPTVGYYASGRVDFVDHYRTYPVVLAPLFGHMVAEQIFAMWNGMRRAGTLSERDRFTIAEFGPGDGALAEAILDYLVRRAAEDAAWRTFADQVLYVCYDRSPSLNKVQQERNARFGKRFEARVADATNMTATIAKGSLKGVVLSNELPDAFSVHKTILSADGTAEVAFVVPALPAETWRTVQPLLSATAAQAIEADDKAIEDRFLGGQREGAVYLSKASFVALLEHLRSAPTYEATANAMQFRELYAPATTVPIVAEHLGRYAEMYAGVLARDARGLVTYVNPGAERFIRDAAQVLSAGYMLTIDYGGNFEEMLNQHSYPRFRTYGPASRNRANLAPNQVDTFAPYVGPTLNDFTTDANFTLLAAEGELVGLKAIYYGAQRALQAGTSVSLDTVPSARENEGNAAEFQSWATSFAGPSVYKMLLQQKTGTDPAYRFAGQHPESLGLGTTTLDPAQRSRADQIAARLKAQAAVLKVSK
ncbi:MAG TPA: SAM-dependent methyltransferase [Vicinamibacterales bacterium]|nr:SAM-dependent methyltransferase [Vicinamibacterales bacterium]